MVPNTSCSELSYFISVRSVGPLEERKRLVRTMSEEIPQVLTVLFGLTSVYAAMTPLFGNHIMLYGAVFIFMFILVQLFTPPYLMQQAFVGDEAGGKQ